MAAVPRSLLNNQAKQINELASALQKVLTTELNALEYTDIPDLRMQTRNIAKRYIQEACDMACASEGTFYNAVQLQQTGDVNDYNVNYTIDEYALDGAIRAFLTQVENGNYDEFVRLVCDRADREVRKAAAQSTAQRLIQDKKAIRFARVPSGSETCVFCLMLASRGAVYTSAISAGEWNHYHSHCDCRIVPAYSAKFEVEGLDIDGLANRFGQCRQTIQDSSIKAWKALSAEEKAKYGNYNSYQFGQIINEARKRNIGWLRDNEISKETIQEGAHPDDAELQLSKILRKNGFSVDFLKPSKLYKVRTADSYLNRRKWEFKNPIGNGKLNIVNQIKKNIYGKRKNGEPNLQSDRLVISNVNSDMTFERICDDVEKILKGDDPMFVIEDIGLMKEILVVDKSGKMKRYSI